MEIKTVSVNDIHPAAYNPRRDLKPADPEYQHLQKSIAEFDIVEPLVWNKRTGNLVGGHQRFKVLKDRGDTTVQVSVVDLDDTREKALNLALNKISGEWDVPLLKDLLQSIDTGELPDIEVTGFTEAEIEELMTQVHVDEPGTGQQGYQTPVIQFNIIFDTEAQQDAWYAFLKQLKDRYPDKQTVAQRIVAHIEEGE